MATTTGTPDNGGYSTKEFDIENGTRVFNIDELKNAMSSLQGLFDDFASELKTANDLVTSDVNASCEHCVFGDHGMFMLNLWTENASTFHDFNANFTKWSQAIAVIANKNANFTNVVEGIYNNRRFSDNALTISATYNGKDYTSASDMRADIIVENADVTTDASGNKTTAYFDEKGNYIVEVTDKDGNLVSLEKTYYDKDNNLVVEKYDADGKTLNEKTTTKFDEFGRALTITSIVGGVLTTTNNEYDSNGRLLKTETTDIYGAVKSSTTNTYDANGNLVKTETVDGSGQVTYSQETKYDASGLVESVTTVDNGTTTTISNTYDVNGNVTEVKTVVTDDSGNVKSTTTDTYEYTTETETDAEGNVISTTTTTVTSVDGDGNSLGTTVTETKVSGDTTITTVTKNYGSGSSSTVQTATTKTESGTTQKVTTTDSSGAVTSVETKRGEDGSVTEVVTTDKDGNTSTVTHNEDGTTTTTYRNSNGDEIPAEEKPDSFNEDGSLKDDSEQQGTQPTTEAPTSEAPTSEAPTSEAPTSEAPTTEAPTEAATEAVTEAATEADSLADTGALGTTETLMVKSGQKVTLASGEEAYFVMGHDGQRYYTSSDSPDAQVLVLGEDGKLTPYLRYGDDIVSRSDFVNSYKNNMDVQWNESFKNGTSPYTSVGSDVNASFTEKVSGSNTGATYVTYDTDYLRNNASTLGSIDRGSLSLGTADKPEVVYLAPGQSIKYDKPWDTYDNVISGGDNGTYLVYDSNSNGYYVVNSDGTYDTSDTYFGGYISYDQLMSERTKWND